MVKIANNEYCLFCCTVPALRIQTPVNDVEEQVSHGKDDSGVRVDHVAVAHDEAQVLLHRVLAAQPGSLRGPGDGGVSRLAVPLCVRGAGNLREGRHVDVIVMETAIEGHCLSGIEGVGDLWRRRQKRRRLFSGSKMLF